jgi:hypothetical protein
MSRLPRHDHTNFPGGQFILDRIHPAVTPNSATKTLVNCLVLTLSLPVVRVAF